MKQPKKPRGGQKGNRNACKHGFYSRDLSLAEVSEYWHVVRQGIAPEIAFLRVKLQTLLRQDPGNRRALNDASALLTKWYRAEYQLSSANSALFSKIIKTILASTTITPGSQSALSEKSNHPLQNESSVL